MGNLIRRIKTSKKVNVHSCLPEFSAKKTVMWKCHIDEYTTVRYDMILGRDLLTALVLDLKFDENFINGGEGPYKGCSTPMVDVNNYNFGILTEENS